MNVLKLRTWVFPLCLWAVACMNDPGDKPPTGNGPSSGSFQVSLVEPTPISQGFTSVLGKVFNGPTPSAVAWKETAKIGSCRLLIPRAPFCATPCGSGAICVDDNKCQDFPKAIGAGRVTATGLKTKAGATSFTMDPVLNGYQPMGGTIVDFPPFAEGDAVTFSASGDTGVGPFTVSSKGIGPMVLLNDSIVLADGKAINLQWTPPGLTGNSTVSVKVDISHHGGLKGVIDCQAADNGSLEIAASLVDQLKALGVSGFPKMEVTRKATGTNDKVKVDLVIESMTTKDVSIPGLISCDGDEDCPTGQTCQPDLRCQ
jgi:hypothetical protein